MSATVLYQQCCLRQGVTEAIGWIEQRAAKRGATVEPKTEKLPGLWEVIDVYDVTLTEDQVKQAQVDGRTYAKRTDI